LKAESPNLSNDFRIASDELFGPHYAGLQAPRLPAERITGNGANETQQIRSNLNENAGNQRT
jgi:hypothetical protein